MFNHIADYLLTIKAELDKLKKSLHEDKRKCTSIYYRGNIRNW